RLLPSDLYGPRQLERLAGHRTVLDPGPARGAAGRRRRPHHVVARAARRAPRPALMTTRDQQRSRVYEAEGALARMVDRRSDFPMVEAFGSRVAVPDDRKFGDIASVQRY